MSAAKGTRKGFTFTKGKRVTDTETLNFEDADNSSLLSVRKSPRRRASSNNSPDTINSGRKSKKSRLNTDVRIVVSKDVNVSVTEKQKLKYPTILHNLEPSVPTSLNHAEIIATLVAEICVKEKAGLLNSFQPNEGEEEIPASKQITHESLITVLNSLAKSVACPFETTFIPEFCKEEKLELEWLIKKRDALQCHSDKLCAFESDIAVFEKEYDLWLSPERSTSGMEGQNKISIERPEIEAAQQYGDMLSKVEASCKEILEITEDTKKLMSTARMTQDILYDTFNKTRLELSTDPRAQKDTKDILRQLPAMF